MQLNVKIPVISGSAITIENTTSNQYSSTFMHFTTSLPRKASSLDALYVMKKSCQAMTQKRKALKRSNGTIGTKQAKRIKLNAKRQEICLDDKSGVERVADCMERMERNIFGKVKVKTETEQRKIAL